MVRPRLTLIVVDGVGKQGSPRSHGSDVIPHFGVLHHDVALESELELADALAQLVVGRLYAEIIEPSRAQHFRGFDPVAPALRGHDPLKGYLGDVNLDVLSRFVKEATA